MIVLSLKLVIGGDLGTFRRPAFYQTPAAFATVPENPQGPALPGGECRELEKIRRGVPRLLDDDAEAGLG